MDRPIDWSRCNLVERVPGKVSGQWIVRGTRILADGIVENAEAGFNPEAIAEELYQGLSPDVVRAIIEYAHASDLANGAASKDVLSANA